MQISPSGAAFLQLGQVNDLVMGQNAHINVLYLLAVALGWALVYYVVYWGTAIARDSSLICWGVGPLGLTVVSLRRPASRQLLLQFLSAGLAVACVADVSLFLARPGPITGLSVTIPTELSVIALIVLLATVLRLLWNLRARRFPLWGEARVMAAVQRSVATGAVLFFTPTGRAFLRERFGATPGEFIQTMRS